jgi:TonB family protein
MNHDDLRETKAMRAKTARRAAAVTLLLAIAVSGAPQVGAQSSEAKRPAKHLVTPTVPDLARKLNLSGTVRIEVTIAPDGNVKRSRVIGGHPVLAMAAEIAAQKSTFEPGPTETTEIIEFKF